MLYDNNKCDGCGVIMHDGEDIVVCPVCGTPQHRECYNENKRCVNEHLHESGFKWKPEFVPEPPKPQEKEAEPDSTIGNTTPIMPVTANKAEDLFLRNVLYDPNDEFDGIKVREAAVFIQQGSSRYVKKFMKSKGKKLTWNWAAFFLTPFWFFYRKLYKAGLIFLCVSVALSIAVDTYSQKVVNNCPKFSEAMSAYSEAIEQAYSNFGNLQSEEMSNAQKNIITASQNNGHILIKVVGMRVAVLLAQGIVAALLADFLFKKRLTQIVHLSREINDNNSKIYSIARSGGVSIFMTLLALVVSMYLPDIIYSIASNINF